MVDKNQVYREKFLARLNKKLSQPTAHWPSVRCWTATRLKVVFKSVRDELETEGFKSLMSQSALLDWLCEIGLACHITLDDCKIPLLELGVANQGDQVDVSPLELLMAAKPSEVICYFSAVAFHALTTQIVEHHHVAELIDPNIESQDNSIKSQDPEEDRLISSAKRRSVPSLGILLFRFHGVPYFKTRRSSRMIPGFQTRCYGPRTNIRITTLEQTLLDTLHKPFYCGGPEVVFEACQEAIGSQRIDEDRLVGYLKAMNYPATTRRLGVMYDLVGGRPGDELLSFLHDTQMVIDRHRPHVCISLLPGVGFQNLRNDWLVYTP